MGFNEASETLNFSFGRWAEKCGAPQHVGCARQASLRPADAEGFTPHPSGLGSVSAEDCTHAAKPDLNTVAPDPCSFLVFLCAVVFFPSFCFFFLNLASKTQTAIVHISVSHLCHTGRKVQRDSPVVPAAL